MCWVVSAGTSFQIVIHGQLQPTFLQSSFVGLCVHTGDWAGCKMPGVPVLTQRCGCCQVVVNWYWMLCHTQFIHNLVWNEQWSATVSAGCLCPLATSSVQPLGWDWEPPYVSIPKCQWLHRWRLGIDKWLHPTHYNRRLLLHAGIKVKPHESQGPLVGDVIPNLHGTRLWVILFSPKCPGWVD